MSKRKIGYLSVAIAIAAGGGLGVTQKLAPRAAVAAGFAARVVCACHFVGNRDLASCRHDLEPGTEPVKLTIDENLALVTARYPVLATRSATYSSTMGCVLNPVE